MIFKKKLALVTALQLQIPRSMEMLSFQLKYQLSKVPDFAHCCSDE